ncbi:DUF2892 family protein [Natronomonas pharaonis DSM 2160]|uniref:DUF2892 family protein n=1 Tax=Natronomonas pharaonis (strain ATCC 35678 / DSM 2160 / CIP 103997 / JCM 8858 / NBRC 14720 / NCIMB 2260 / Gabara) TaxID=348780 RepID=A0A1U7EYM0_NATPD|nr:DUF2892 domain-containing protein [Natronomonas pharaonis]CAI50325.1 DUF2892 family protein [Natronomonas pharaonis DSM 2160]
MERNVGPLDARIRVLVGIVLCGLALAVARGVVGVPLISSLGLGIAGVVLVVEGSLRRCLLYQLLGINRCPRETK